MTLDHLLDLAKEFSDMGDAVGEQLQEVLAGGNSIGELIEEGQLNPNVLRYVESFLKSVIRKGDSDLVIEAQEAMEGIAEWRRSGQEASR